MSIPLVPRRQAAYAEFYSDESRGLKLMPPLNWLIVGNNNVPKGWQHIQEEASLFSPWVEFDGDPNGTKLPIPRLYKLVGIISVRNSDLRNLHKHYDEADVTREAVALSLGQAVAIGALGKGVIFATDKGNESLRLVGARISKKGLIATAGLWLPNERCFISAESSHYSARIPINNVPLEIPIV